MSGFNGHNQSAGTPHAKGPISQRQLVGFMRVLVDTARSRAGSKTRDDARTTLRAIQTAANWNTPYVLLNIGLRRRRWLRSFGYDIDTEWLRDADESLTRLATWRERNGRA